MKTLTEHLARLRDLAFRGLMRVLFTEEAIGRGETAKTPNHQSQVTADSPPEAADAARAQAGRKWANASCAGQG